MSFLLVPGAGGDAWYWHRVVPLLEQQGHAVVAVDLPAADDAAGLAEYADAIVAAGRGLSDRGGLVVVAQSLGGFSAPLAAERLDVTRIVLVNAMVPAPGETAGDWWAATGQPEAARAAAVADGRDPDAPFDPADGFFHDVPDEVRRTAFTHGAPHESDRVFADPWPLAAWPDVPTSSITGRDDRLFPAGFQQRLLRERLGIEPTVVAGGHLVSLANPDGLVDALLR